MHRVEVFVPINPHFPARELELKLTQLAGGMTMHRAIGAYVMPDGSVCREAVDVMLVFVPDNEMYIEHIEALLWEYKREAQQQCVLYTKDGAPMFLKEEAHGLAGRPEVVAGADAP